MKRKNIIFIILCVICIGTIALLIKSPDKSNNYPTSGITWDCSHTLEDSFKLSSLVKECQFIPLELTDKSVIGNIDKVLMADTLLFVMDSRISGGVFVFNIKNGTFIRKIGDIGNGHGEYHELYDMAIDTATQSIFLLCEKRRLLRFSFSGQYKEEKALPFLAINVEYWKNKFYFVNGTPHEDNLYITDTNFDILSTHFPNDEYGENHRRLVHPFQQTQEGVLYHRFLDNHIYRIDGNGKVSILYTLDFGIKELGIEDIQNMPHQQLKNAMAQSKCHIKYFTEGNTYAVAIFFDEDKPIISIFDKEKKTVTTHDYSKMKNDLLGLSFPLLEFTSPDAQFMTAFYYQDIEQLTKNGFLDQETYSQDSNPILCIFQ